MYDTLQHSELDLVVYSDIGINDILLKLVEDKNVTIMLASEDDFCAICSFSIGGINNIRVQLHINLIAKVYVSIGTRIKYRYKYTAIVSNCKNGKELLRKIFNSTEVYTKHEELQFNNIAIRRGVNG